MAYSIYPASAQDERALFPSIENQVAFSQRPFQSALPISVEVRTSNLAHPSIARIASLVPAPNALTSQGLNTQYGHREGTDTFNQCVQSEARAAEARDQADYDREVKDYRARRCSAGDEGYCDNGRRTLRTNCTGDGRGNSSCETR